MEGQRRGEVKRTLERAIRRYRKAFTLMDEGERRRGIKEILELYKEYLDLTPSALWWREGLREEVEEVYRLYTRGEEPKKRGRGGVVLEHYKGGEGQGKGWLGAFVGLLAKAGAVAYAIGVTFSALQAPQIPASLYPPSPVEEELVKRGRYRALSKALGKLFVVEPRQRGYLYVGGKLVDSFLISTGVGGWGYGRGSWKTPPGLFKTSFRQWLGNRVRGMGITLAEFSLHGVEENRGNAEWRGILIHGTTEEEKLGRQASHGCIRVERRGILSLLRLGSFYTLVVSPEPMTTSLRALEGSAEAFNSYLSSLSAGERR